MEDSHIMKPNLVPGAEISLFGVFDGHGGKEVSKYCELHFADVFTSKLEEQAEKNIKVCLESTFL